MEQMPRDVVEEQIWLYSVCHFFSFNSISDWRLCLLPRHKHGSGLAGRCPDIWGMWNSVWHKGIKAGEGGGAVVAADCEPWWHLILLIHYCWTADGLKSPEEGDLNRLFAAQHGHLKSWKKSSEIEKKEQWWARKYDDIKETVKSGNNMNPRWCRESNKM